MKFRPDGLKNVLKSYGASSLREAIENQRTSKESEINRREDLWEKYTLRVQAAHGIRAQVAVPIHLQSKLKMVLKALEKDILEHKEAELVSLLEEWESIWMEAIKADGETD